MSVRRARECSGQSACSAAVAEAAASSLHSSGVRLLCRYSSPAVASLLLLVIAAAACRSQLWSAAARLCSLLRGRPAPQLDEHAQTGLFMSPSRSAHSPHAQRHQRSPRVRQRAGDAAPRTEKTAARCRIEMTLRRCTHIAYKRLKDEKAVAARAVMRFTPADNVGMPLEQVC
jgi:hypothetical protein